MRALQLVNTPRSFFDEQVAALERRGVECTTLTVPGTHSPTETRSPLDYLRYVPDVLSHSRDGYDVIHAHYGLLGPIALAQPSRPVVLHLWGSDLLGDGAVPRVSRLAARLADAVIVPSRPMSERLSVPHEVVPWGVDTDRFRPIDRAAARERLGWDRDERIVLFPYPPGREIKNYPLAERVLERADVDAELRTMNGVPYDEVPYYMNASDAVLVTSRRESGPMVVKEAAACNRPVVSTDVGFVRETIGDVDGSYVCEDEAALVAGLEAALGGDGRCNGRDRIEGLDLGAMADSITRVYERAGASA